MTGGVDGSDLPVTRVYTIWPADREGLPAASSSAWRQQTRWLVLDVTDGLEAAHVVEGPVSRSEALRRELEIRAIARDTARSVNRPVDTATEATTDATEGT